MTKKQILLTILIGLLSSFLLACSGVNETPQPDQTTIPPVTIVNNNVVVEGFLAPKQEANLAFETGGRVVEILVSEGEAVTADQVLIRLDQANAQANIAVAEAGLTQAQATLANSQVSPRPEELAVAEAAIVQAEANLALTVAGVSPQDRAVAEARLTTLRSQLNQVLAGNREESVRASLATLKQAEIDLAEAQSAYDKIAYAADSEQGQVVARALQRASLAHEAALANYEALLNGATPAQVNVALAQVGEGQAALDQLDAGPSMEQVAVAQAGVIQAEAALAQAKLGARPEQIAVAEAGVKQAEAALAQAQLALENLQLTAPMAGTVINLQVDLGEIVSPGVPIVTLADLSTWHLETDNLTEIDVVKVEEGQSAIVTFDALPNETFNGTIIRLDERSQTKAGDVTYTVVIELDTTDPRLRWGMTAAVEIQTEG